MTIKFTKTKMPFLAILLFCVFVSLLVLSKAAYHSHGNSLLYPLKRLSEKIKIELIFDRQLRAKYLTELTAIRLEELTYIVQKDKTGFFEESRDRYISSVRQYNAEYKDMTYLRERKSELLTALSKLRDKYPANSAYWLILQQAVDVTNTI